MSDKNAIEIIEEMEQSDFDGWPEKSKISFLKRIEVLKETILHQKDQLQRKQNELDIRKAGETDLHETISKLQRETIDAKQAHLTTLNDMFGNLEHSKCPECIGKGLIEFGPESQAACPNCAGMGRISFIRVRGKK